MIYLDNAATTPVDPEVAKEMYRFLTEEFGNPSSKYYTQAETAKAALRKARLSIANLINADEDEIIFTSGASESNNFIIKGIADALSNKGKHIITSKVEHKSVLETCRYLETKGYEVTYLGVDNLGHINMDELRDSIRPDTILVSIIWGNNEIGTLNNVKQISKICSEKGVLFHTDATQVLGKVEVDVKDIGADFMSFSAHKIYGPKGIGACYIKNDEYGFKPEITPLIHGGEQEYGLRAGTHSMHNIVGFGKAAEIAKNTMGEYIPKIISLENTLKQKLTEEFVNIKFNGDQDNKIPGILSITIPRLNNELFIKMVKNRLSISTGSACSLGQPSYVLREIGITNFIHNTIRLSLNKNSNLETLSIIDEIKNYFKLYIL